MTLKVELVQHKAFNFDLDYNSDKLLVVHLVLDLIESFRP